MKSFVKKIILFVGIYLVITNVIFLFVPYHFGNPWYSTKVNFLEEKEKDISFNTFFFGSSRIYRQINPSVFDSICSSQKSLLDKKIRSFNLGAPATFAPQTYYLYEKFLDSKLSGKVKYCFLEISDVQRLPSDQLGQERTNYFIDLNTLLFSCKSFFNDTNYDIAHKMYYSSLYFLL